LKLLIEASGQYVKCKPLLVMAIKITLDKAILNMRNCVHCNLSNATKECLMQLDYN
jgi:hypothetical protein